jgi:hypothetical protein
MKRREVLSPGARELRRLMGEVVQEVFRPAISDSAETGPIGPAAGDDAPKAAPAPPPSAEASDV